MTDILFQFKFFALYKPRLGKILPLTTTNGKLSGFPFVNCLCFLFGMNKLMFSYSLYTPSFAI